MVKKTAPLKPKLVAVKDKADPAGDMPAQDPAAGDAAVLAPAKPVKTAKRVFWILRHNSHVIRARKFRNMRDGAKPCANILA